jgi:hypothetical protein
MEEVFIVIMKRFRSNCFEKYMRSPNCIVCLDELRRIFNEQTSRNCDVALDAIQTSLFIQKVDGKLCNIDRFPLVVFYANILQCFFVVEHFTANAVSVVIGDNRNRMIFEIWWNYFYDLFLC